MMRRNDLMVAAPLRHITVVRCVLELPKEVVAFVVD